MESAFSKRAKSVVITGYPCNDTLLSDMSSPFIDEDKNLIQKFKANQKKVILYMPTYRDSEIYESKSTNIPIDWKRFDAFLEKNNCVFIMKLHPVKKSTSQVANYYKNILAPNNLNDIYPALKYADILITDYSTVCYNFLLCSKPIIFYWYDFEKYKARDRSLYEDFKNLLMGPRVKTFDALLNALDDCINNKNNFIEENLKQINHCRSIAQKYFDANSSERVYQEIIKRFVK
jgi:CDP-glycerol glycerophosphotransferase (TagB/SpsB family)